MSIILFLLNVLISTALAVCDGDVAYLFKDGSSNIFVVNITDGSLIEEIPTDLDANIGFVGSAINPIDGAIYVVLRPSSSVVPRVLATITISGQVTEIGELSGNDGFGRITFDCDGNLYGITGDQFFNPADTNRSAIYLIDTQTADTQFIISRDDDECTTGRAGEALAFNYENELFYRASGTSSSLPDADNCVRFEEINIDELTVSVNEINITDNGYWNWQIRDLDYIGNDRFLALGDGSIFTITTDGVIENQPVSVSARYRAIIPTINIDGENELCSPSLFCAEPSCSQIGYECDYDSDCCAPLTCDSYSKQCTKRNTDFECIPGFKCFDGLGHQLPPKRAIKQIQSISNARECARKCKKNGECESFTFVEYDYDETICYLFDRKFIKKLADDYCDQCVSGTITNDVYMDQY